MMRANSATPPAPSYDVDLKQRISHFLADRARPTLKRLRVDVENGSVTLSGDVNSFYEKQIALNCCQRVAGVRRLIDALVVN